MILCSLVAAISFAGCSQKNEMTEEARKYKATMPVLTDTSVMKDYVAQIQSIQNVEIRAMVDGYLDEIYVDEGQQVSEGQLLFSVRSTEYEADLNKAKANVAETEIELKNTKILAEKNIVSQNELALAQAKLQEAKAEVARAELYLTYTKIKAPFSGTLDRLMYKKGSLVDRGTVLTSISNNREVFAYFNFSEREYLDYKTRTEKDKNQITLLLANGQPHKYPGAIETIEGQFDNTTGTIAMRARFPNPDFLLRHGETGKVLLPVKLKNVMLIPQKATYELQDKIFVFKIKQDNVVQSVPVNVLQTIPDYYIIDSGLQPGDRFLIEGVQNVKDDDKVEVEMVKSELALK